MKRTFDLLAAFMALLLFWPLLLLIAIAVRVRLGGPVLFVQQRTGLHGRSFPLIKFRTMTSACGADGRLLPDEQRVTRFGNFLRKSSLDELPELGNILLGQMSFVGPRPLLPEYLERYSARQRRRLDVRPGLTGWAQVNGRNAVSWEERFEHDVWYVEHRSFALDLMILWRTVKIVLLQSGANPAGQVTMAPFMGSSNAATQTEGAKTP